MLESKLQIINKLGLHARATAKLVRLLQEYQSDVELEYNGLYANGKSMMGVMMLAAAKGSFIFFTVRGADQDDCLKAIQDLLMDRFGENE